MEGQIGNQTYLNVFFTQERRVAIIGRVWLWGFSNFARTGFVGFGIISLYADLQFGCHFLTIVVAGEML